MTAWTWIALAGLIASACGATAFPLLYARSPWWERDVGRSTFVFSVVLAAVLVLTVFGQFGLRLPVWVVAVLFAAMAASVWWRVVTLWRAQHRGRETVR